MAAVVRSCIMERFAFKIRNNITLLYSATTHFHWTSEKRAIFYKMPSLSPTMTSGTIVNWIKKEGDTINPGDVLCEIQTDKAVMSLETEEEGILAKIISNDGKLCEVGAPIAILAEPGENWNEVALKECQEDQNKINKASQLTEKASSADGNHIALGPAARLILKKYGLKKSQIVGTGPKGIVLKSDVLSFIAQEQLQPVPTVELSEPQIETQKIVSDSNKGKLPKSTSTDALSYYDIKLNHEERESGHHILHSKMQTAHSYGSVSCRLDNVKKICTQYQKEGIQVSTLDFIVKAASVALLSNPSLSKVRKNGQLPTTINVFLTSITDDGPFQSIVTDSHTRNLHEIRTLLGKSVSSTLESKKEESFMLYDLSQSAVESCKAVISSPNCATLTIGAECLVFSAEEKPSIFLNATLSFDEEAIAFEEASSFLTIFKNLLESPESLILGLVDTAIEQAVV